MQIREILPDKISIDICMLTMQELMIITNSMKHNYWWCNPPPIGSSLSSLRSEYGTVSSIERLLFISINGQNQSIKSKKNESKIFFINLTDNWNLLHPIIDHQHLNNICRHMMHLFFIVHIY